MYSLYQRTPIRIWYRAEQSHVDSLPYADWISACLARVCDGSNLQKDSLVQHGGRAFTRDSVMVQ